MRAAWILSLTAVFVWSGIAPADALAWLLEALPVLSLVCVLAASRKVFPLTPLAYGLLWCLFVIMLIGGHYGYGQVPWFDGLKELLAGSRNQFDKLAHFFQGAVPAVVFREIILRRRVVRPPRWRSPLAVTLALSLSAVYEVVEWATWLLLGPRAEPFIAAQGDPWDAPSDLALALAGAVLAVIALARLHDRQIDALWPR